MKNTIGILFVLALLLSACGGKTTLTLKKGVTPTAGSTLGAVAKSPAAYPAAGEPSAPIVDNPSTYPAPGDALPAIIAEVNAATLDTSYENAVSVEVQLIVGTLQLTGTEQAVTTEQASQLLPLWDEYRGLRQSVVPGQGGSRQAGSNQSGTSVTPEAQGVITVTQAQIDTLVAQIQAVMTEEQIRAIAAMQITQETISALSHGLGLSANGPRQGALNNTGNGSQPPTGGPGSSGQPPEGTPPAGAPGSNPGDPGDGGQPPGDGQIPGQIPGGGMVPPELMNALRQMLVEISGMDRLSPCFCPPRNLDLNPWQAREVVGKQLIYPSPPYTARMAEARG